MMRATPTPQPQPGRSTNEAPTSSRSSAAVSRPSTSAAHGQFIRSKYTVTHSSSSADTLLDVRTSTPDTGVGRGTEPPVTRIQTAMPPPQPPPPPQALRQLHEQCAPRHEPGWMASVEDPGVMPPALPYDPWQHSCLYPPQHNHSLMSVMDITHRLCHRMCLL
ncbi:histone-lysine N-methyltransferase SETD1A-like isoform X3 [Bombina bombina]|uniref:histone-lysine N-methyltransferase SETD1A-like isoform X3 n=1 Tax=Bombina bombina TaxID=8345 RepID=UPI00235A65AD|nr:histone-lysine N-methyltransferase SETD1A-like isoform X3 [Bombina bombina]